MEQEDICRRQIQVCDEPIGKRSLRLEEDGSDGGERTKHSSLDLPEDIWCHIHSLLPMRDAVQAACVSRVFLHSWRYRPNLTFSMKTLGMDKSACGEDEIAINFSSKVDHILKSHSCICVKSLKIVFYHYNAEACNVDSWLQTAVKPGIEELTVQLSRGWETYYNFPWPLLTDGSGNSIRYLNLAGCAFSPTAGLGFRSMARLDLCDVRITEDQLGCLLHNSFALEWMQLSGCNELYCLKVPFLLQQLRYLQVFECRRLQVVESEAPNLSNFHFFGHREIKISLGVALQLKNLFVSCRGAVCYARADLPSCLPNVEAISLSSRNEMVNTPILPSKFLHLKYLTVDLGAVTFSPSYDYCSLLSFFDAYPSLGTFILNVFQMKMEHESVVGDPSHLRQITGHRHDNLKTVKIMGFSSAKSLVELTCHIAENAMSLEHLTLDTTRGLPLASCSSNKSGKCLVVHMDVLVEAGKGLLAIRTYVEPKVPSRVKLTVVEPCRRCHDPEL